MDSHFSLSQLKTSIPILALIFVAFYLLVHFLRGTYALPLSTLSSPANTTQYKLLPFEPKMVSLSGGLTSMGCLQKHINCEADERIHDTHVDPFSVGIFEVTNRQIVPFLNALGLHKRASDKHPLLEIKSEDADSHILYKNGVYIVEPGFEDYPVVEICWLGATVYAQWLSQITGKNYRLPTEAEWEYMARAGTSSQYPWAGNHWRDQANCDGCTGFWNDKDHLKPVGSYPPNAWGLYDVLGNVWEWTCSAYDSQYTGDEGKCVSDKSNRDIVLRGSSWFNDPWDTRLSNRSYQQKWHQDYHSGFRLVMNDK